MRASIPLATLLLLLAITACETLSPSKGVLARVGDAVFTEEDLKARLPIGLAAERAAAERAQLIDIWVRQELFYQEAMRRKLDENARLHHLLLQARRDLLAAALLDEEFAGQEAEIDETAIQTYYQEHAEEFQRTRAEIRIRHILLASQRDANAKRQALQREEAFEDLAREFSLDPDSRFQGGDLGYLTEAQDPVLWNACQNLSLQRISKPVRSEYGYHLIQVLDRQEVGSLPALEQVRPRVVEALVRRRHQEQLNQLLERLKSTHDWAIIGQAHTDTL